MCVCVRNKYTISTVLLHLQQHLLTGFLHYLSFPLVHPFGWIYGCGLELVCDLLFFSLLIEGLVELVLVELFKPKGIRDIDFLEGVSYQVVLLLFKAVEINVIGKDRETGLYVNLVRIAFIYQFGESLSVRVWGRLTAYKS
jgi:hypothetical protein